MRRVLWWLIGGTRGGRNRLRIIRTVEDTPMNANQLAETLDLNYKTVQHHLELLTENDVLTTMGDSYGATYFLSDAMESNLDVLDDVATKADLDVAVDDDLKEEIDANRARSDAGDGSTPDGTADEVGVGGEGEPARPVDGTTRREEDSDEIRDDTTTEESDDAY